MNVWVTRHAAERFVERVRPAMAVRDGGVELARLLREFGARVEKPAWLEHLELEGEAFLVGVSDGIVVVCVPAPAGNRWPQAMTVLTRSSLGDANRRARQRGRRQYRGAKGRLKAKTSQDRQKTRAERRERRPRARDWSPE